MRRALFVYVSLSLCACGGSQKAGTTAAKVEAPPNESAVRLFVTGAEQLEVGSPKALVRAKELLQKALALDPRLWEAHYDLGLTERKLGDLDAARASLLKARELAPDASEPLTLRLYKNDEQECASPGEFTLAPGHQQEVRASF